MKMHKKVFIVSLIFIIMIFLSVLYSGLSDGDNTIAKTTIPFHGTASGGVLTIGYNTGNPHNIHIVSVNTIPGETCSSVVYKLAKAVLESKAIFDYDFESTEFNVNEFAKKMALDNSLRIRGFLGRWSLAGTETGLGIPKPPIFLSCNYNEKNNTYEVKWNNPKDENKYDSFFIRWNYINLNKKDGGFFPDTRNNFTIKGPDDINNMDLDVWISGYRHNMPPNILVEKRIPLGTDAIPSNLTAIHVTSKGYCQEETYGIPFYAGIAPNWTAWSTSEKIDSNSFEQGNKYPDMNDFNHIIRSLLSKPYYQIIKAPPEGAVHGVYRKFLGLMPGHTYRVTGCINTLEMDSVKDDWSLSLCAAANGPDGKDLSIHQLAGASSLPSGAVGPKAGRFALYDKDKTTKGKFSLAFSGEQLADGTNSSHITLPPDSDTITVWVRFSCSAPNGNIGFSGVRLEDITEMKNIKPPKEVIQKELQEADFIEAHMTREQSR